MSFTIEKKVDQKLQEAVLSIDNCCKRGDIWQLKSVFLTLFSINVFDCGLHVVILAQCLCTNFVRSITITL